MTRIYRYILTHDVGMAPCPVGGRISLATCKPVIRRTAAPGDWVLGFVPGTLHRGQLLWAGQVEEVMSHGDYQRAHGERPDAVYLLAHEGHYVRLVPDYHPSQWEMDRDLSAPVLLFDRANSIHLGGRPVSLPEGLAHLAAAGRGHRVNGTHPSDVAALQAWLATLERPAAAMRIRKGLGGSCSKEVPAMRRSARGSCG